MATVIRTLVFSVLCAVALIAAWPWIDTAIYALRLTRMSAPETLAVPVEGVKPKALQDTWHASRPPRRRHEGIDIFARKGTPVVASTEGVVLRRGQNALGGNVVWVLGPGGQHHYYAHLDQFSSVSTGERVVPGTVLGTVGNTGNAKTTPPHLHYGVYGNAGPVNPYPLLTGRGTPK